MNVKINGKLILWYKNDVKSMTRAQLQLNDLLLTQKLDKDDILLYKNTLRALQDDYTEHITSVCSVCGDKQNLFTHLDIEHIKIKHSWGYESNYDCSTHELTLCCDCYTNHIIKSDLGKYVKINQYM